MKHPELFLPWMEALKTTASETAGGLAKIFDEHGVPEHARVLDLASGIGRISINLAERGYDVVGTDISPLYLRYAERWARREGVDDRVRLYRVESRDTARLLRRRENKFDAIINIGTAMGYYGTTDDLRTFASLRSIAGPRALLVINTVNRDYLIRHFQQQSIARIGNVEWHEVRSLNNETSSMENLWRFYRKRGGSMRLALEIPISHRVYSLHELKSLLESAGWKYRESFGSLRDLTPLTTDSIHMTVVSRKI